MLFRMIFGLPGAAIITALLFLAMGWMVRMQDAQIVDPPPPVGKVTFEAPLPEILPIGPKPKPEPAPETPKIKFPKPIGPGPGVPTDPITGPTSDGKGKIVLPVGTPPSVTFAPIYPENCRAKGAQGIVMVEFDVTADGAVVNPRVVASENSCLDRAAIQTISKWKFSPKTDSDGRAVAQRGLRQTFNFQLTDG
ncbi:MAG: TonB family protein [Pseudomonadota bacterium]